MATSSDDDDKGKDSAEDTDTADEVRGETASSNEDDDGDRASGDPAANAKAAPKPTKPTAAAPPAAPPRAPATAGLGKSVALFVGVVGGISLLMVALGNERGTQGPAAPKWTEGQTVEIDITLVSTDRQDLACASGTELKGLHCAFESQTKRWSKGDANDDKTMLKPYSTTNGINFFASGVWSSPALSGDNKLPATRFAVKCKFNVAGKLPRADVRWHEGEGWNNVSDWYAGSVSDCKMGAIQQ